jgi:hypothetical protein
MGIVMNRLNTDAINRNSPYDVYCEGNDYVFVTDTGIEYHVDFELDSNPFFVAYWFNLANPEQQKSHGDKKIPQTIICIIEEFFNKNPEIMLYMCSTANNKQAQRARLFLRWFNGYEQQQRYYIKAVEVKNDDGGTDYVALIMQRTHPQFNDIVSRYDSEIAMFNELKP